MSVSLKAPFSTQRTQCHICREIPASPIPPDTIVDAQLDRAQLFVPCPSRTHELLRLTVRAGISPPATPRPMATCFTFAPDGEKHYRIEAFGASARFARKRNLGLGHIRSLLETPGEPIPVRQLLGVGNDIQCMSDKFRRRKLSEDDAMVDLMAYVKETEQVKDIVKYGVDPEEHHEQPTWDRRTIRQVRAEMRRFDDQRKAAEKRGDQTRAAAAQARFDELKRFWNGAMGRRGRSRDLNNPLDRLRPLIYDAQQNRPGCAQVN